MCNSMFLCVLLQPHFEAHDLSGSLTPADSNCASICLYHLVSQRPYPRIPAPRMAHATLSPRVLFRTLSTYVFNSVHHMRDLK